MLLAWAAGEDADADGRPLPGDALWQAELWRRLRERLAGDPDPAARLDAACARLREDAALVELPQRVSLFGLTRLPAASLQVLGALAEHRDVQLFVLHPSPALWERVAARRPRPATRPAAPTTSPATCPRNRLLASWGQDARELQLVLRGVGGEVREHHHLARHAGGTLLARVQADVRADRASAGAPLPDAPDARPLLDPDDRSIQVHACHGRSRQVEVLRDAILHLLDGDPTLEPRDVIVMCPDIETFAPLVQATFGAGQIAGDEIAPLPADVRPTDLRVRLADRSLRQTNPILGVVSALLELAGGRVTASQVLDLADRAPVRRRFELDDDDLSRIEEWVGESGIRWGLDAEHRAPFRLEALAAGTWRAGLDRLLVGVTMTASQGLLGGVLALDDVDSGAIDLAGRLAELVDRLRVALDALARRRPIGGWARGDRRRGGRADRDDADRGLAARGAAAPARRPRHGRDRGGEVNADVARARGAAGAARRAPRGSPDARELPHRAHDVLHADADALRAASRRLPAGPRRRRVPAPDRPRRRRPRARRSACRRPRPAQRGSPAAARRAARRDRPPRRHVHRQRRAHEHRAPGRRARRRAARHDRRDRARADGRRAREQVVVRHPLQPFDPRNFVAGRIGR